MGDRPPAVRLQGLTLANPVMVAAGALGFGVDTSDLPAGLQPGAAVTAGVASRGRRGTAPRLREAPAGALFVPGTARVGVAGVVRRYARAWAAGQAPVVVNLLADDRDAFAAAAAELEGVRGVAAVELNLAGIDEVTGEPFGFAPASVAEIIRATRRVCGAPVVAKLPADAPALEEAIRAGAAAGAAAVTVAAGWPVAHGEPAYLVGPATFPLALALVERIAPGAALPVIACGGVATTEHAQAYVQAGAAAVQVGSAHLANPRAAADVLRGLLKPSP